MERFYVCFPEGKFKVLTLSYDDGKVMDRRLVDIFNQYGLKATFHLNTDYFGCSKGHQYPYIQKDEVMNLYQGHEVACHTCSHPTMTRISHEAIIHEVLDNREALELLVHQGVRGMSYPNGVYNQNIKDILRLCGIAYSRTTQNTNRFDIPDDFLEWHPTCHHCGNLLELTETFLKTTYDQRLMLFYVWGHSYEFERDNNWNFIETFAKKISHHHDVWYTTNIEVYNYLKCASQLQYAANQSFVYNPNHESVWLKCDEKVIEVPGGKQIWLK